MSNRRGAALTVGFMVVQSGARVEVGDLVAGVRYDDGLTQEFPLDRLRLADFRHSVPWRQVRSRHGQAHYSGSYASATTGGCEISLRRIDTSSTVTVAFSVMSAFEHNRRDRLAIDGGMRRKQAG